MGSPRSGGNRDIYDFVYSCGAHSFNANQALTSQPSIDDRLRVAPAWAASTVFRAGDLCTNGSAPIKLYLCTTGGTSSGSGGPTTTASAISDGTGTVWKYLGNGLNYSELEIFVEAVTAGTLNQAVNVTYSTMGDDGTTLTASRTTGAVGVGAALIVGRMYRLPLQSGDKNAALLTNVAGSVASAGTFNVHLARKITKLQAYVTPFSDRFGYDQTRMMYIPNNAALRDVHTPVSTATMTLPMTLTLAQG